ncbi:MAG TPA: hypothetical protein VIK77_08135 [Tissierellaceae bacterium]
MTNEELLKEAKRRYPVGTKYITAGGSGYRYIIKGDDFQWWEHKVSIYETSSGGLVYNRGKWADIVSEERTEFKKGDYIVCLNTPENDTGFPRNYIFKQRENYKYLRSELDNKGSKVNGWDLVDFNKKERYGQWRYGSAEEIAEYDRIGKPYDVTTLNKKYTVKRKLSDYIGRYIKALVDNPTGGAGVRAGDVGIIVSEYHVDFPKFKGYSCSNALNTPELYELLPVDYKPVEESPMIAIQEEARKRFPIGCRFINTSGIETILEEDDFTYKIVCNRIYANEGNGCLYENGKWATLVEKEANKPSYPLGKIQFKGKKAGDFCPTWETKNLKGIVHGYTKLHPIYETEKAQIVGYDKGYYLVKFPGQCGNDQVIYWTTLGFKENVLEPVQEVEKWGIGTYVVFLQNYGSSKKGDIDVITKKYHHVIYTKEGGLTTQNPEYVKWFATKEEAEEFSKKLLSSISLWEDVVSKWKEEFDIPDSPPKTNKMLRVESPMIYVKQLKIYK